MKKYIVVMVEREDSSNLQIQYVEAGSEDEAFVKFAEKIGHTEDSLDEGVENGDVIVEVRILDQLIAASEE